jgi:aryl-alcohol dehydrogenase-like predicted oxidoreductase
MPSNLNLFRTRFGLEHRRGNLAAVDELKCVTAKCDNNLRQFALRWTLNNPVVGTALVGVRRPAEVTENLGALGWEISDANTAEIGVIFDRHRRYYIYAGMARRLAHSVTIG